MKTNIWRGVAFAVAVIVVGWSAFIVWNKEVAGNNQVMCTMEALLCPDGSGVGREGPQCKFSACPQMSSVTGILRQDSNGFKLVFDSKQGNPMQVSYSMPLVVSGGTSLQDFVNKKVTVYGAFTEGATYAVDHLDLVGNGDATVGEVNVGKANYINGVRITLNKITQDSRCPAGVYCIQAGWVTANVTLQSDTDHDTVDISSNKSVAFDSYKISIEEVKPLKTQNQISQESYLITFKVVSN